MNTENTDKIQGRFQKGQSGNPAGKPKGARHKTTIAMQALLDGQAEAVMQKAAQLALEGDSTALRLCMERLLPARKDSPICFDLPAIRTAEDASIAMAAIIEAVAGGELTPAEGDSVAGLVELQRKVIETKVLEQRIVALEKRK
jgi:hypothetical protein